MKLDSAMTRTLNQTMNVITIGNLTSNVSSDRFYRIIAAEEEDDAVDREALTEGGIQVALAME